MAKNDELKIWKERLSRADRKFKDQMEKLDLYMQYYRSIHWHNKSEAEKIAFDMYHFHPVDNMLYANIRTIVPRLNFRNPKIFVTPRKKPYRSEKGIVDTTSTAIGVEMLLNYWYRHLKSKRETRRCLIDALIAGYGVMEVGFTLKTEKIAQKGKNKGDLLIVDELIKSESPYMVRRSPKDVRWDSEARDSSLADARWISLDWVRDIDDVKADPRFSNTGNLKTNFTIKHDSDSQGTDNSDNTEIWKKVKGRDIWDKKTERVYTIVEGHDKFLRKAKWPEFYDGAFPIETLFFNEHPDESIPIADFDIYKKAQDELNQMRAMTLDHMRRISQRRIFAQEDVLDSDAMRHYEHGPDGTVITVKGNIEQIRPDAQPTISQDMYIGMTQMRDSIREMSGVSPTEALAATKFEQATEPALLEKAATTIREDQRDAFEDFLVRNIKKLAQVLQQHMPETEIPLNVPQFEDAQQFLDSKLHKIVGEDSTILFPWLILSKEDIQGDYDYDIEVGSTQAVNMETRKRDVVQLAEILANNRLIKEREATTRVLEAFNEKDIDRLMKTDEEAAQEQQQEQEAAQQPSPDQQLKTDVDLQKTKIKSAVAIETANIKADTEKGKATANLLAGALKAADKRGNRE